MQNQEKKKLSEGEIKKEHKNEQRSQGAKQKGL